MIILFDKDPFTISMKLKEDLNSNRLLLCSIDINFMGTDLNPNLKNEWIVKYKEDIKKIKTALSDLLEKDDVSILKNLKPYLIDQKSKLLQSILEQLPLKVKKGQVLSYKDYAIKLGFKPSYARVVAKAMSSNKYPLIYPCHRIIPHDGSLGKKFGVTGGLKVKKALLIKEKAWG